MDNSSDKAALILNQHYDESLEVHDSEEVASEYSPSPRKTPPGASNPGLQRLQNLQGITQQPSPDDDNSEFELNEPKAPQSSKLSQDSNQNSYTEGDSDDSDSSTDDDENIAALEGAYDPQDYEQLQVSQEVKELFQYITRYTPQTIELEHKLRPFIPDYIPAVGDIDAFIKVSRPDNKDINLGLTVLDEPAAKQSDPTVLDLELRSISKMTGIKAMQVRSVENAHKNPKAIQKWIESMEELHRSKPPQNVHYTKSMPDIEQLMQEWPPEFEAMLANTELASGDLDCDLQTYTDVICNILDIPVHKSRIESLHVLFSLFMEFKNSQHFQMNTTNEENGENEPEVLTFD